LDLGLRAAAAPRARRRAAGLSWYERKRKEKWKKEVGR
jgi:hypothetical protein